MCVSFASIRFNSLHLTSNIQTTNRIVACCNNLKRLCSCNLHLHMLLYVRYLIARFFLAHTSCPIHISIHHMTTLVYFLLLNWKRRGVWIAILWNIIWQAGWPLQLNLTYFISILCSIVWLRMSHDTLILKIHYARSAYTDCCDLRSLCLLTNPGSRYQQKITSYTF